MGVFFKKEEYADPTKKDAAKMFYPRLVTLGQSVGLDVQNKECEFTFQR